MTEFVFLIIGLMLGGCLGIGILCCMQINRTCHYEQEISRLKEELKEKE